MRYYTAKGDDGTTNLFSCPEGMRLSKNDGVFDVLGGLDELCSFVGLCRSVTYRSSFPKLNCDGRGEVLDTLFSVQEDLFIIQAMLGGSSIKLSKKKRERLEDAIDRFGELFPKVTTFVVPGATELGALLDIARTVARRTERMYVRFHKNSAIGSYLNRLSSLLYVLARTANYAEGESERAPTYR